MNETEAIAPRQLVNPEMIILAREARRLSQTELAEELNFTQSKLCKMETAHSQVSGEDLSKLANVLGFPTAFFTQTEPIYGFGSASIYHRKRSAVLVRDLRAVHGLINVLRLNLGRLLRLAEIDANKGIRRMDVDEYESPEGIARLVRTMWRVPMGPIRNLVLAIENNGGVVFQCSFGTDKIDALCQWPNGLPPLFFVNKDLPVDRWRFSLAHELGHLIMHESPGPDAESEADRFASEFLMPAREVEHDLQRLTLEKAAQLKPHWRVSMQALIRRAKDVGAITPGRYRSLCTAISAEGYRKNEPVTLTPEEPTVVKSLVQMYRDELGYNTRQLSEIALATESHFRETFLNEDRRGLPD